jgi:hypothetical protein
VRCNLSKYHVIELSNGTFVSIDEGKDAIWIGMGPSKASCRDYSVVRIGKLSVAVLPFSQLETGLLDGLKDGDD